MALWGLPGPSKAPRGRLDGGWLASACILGLRQPGQRCPTHCLAWDGVQSGSPGSSHPCWTAASPSDSALTSWGERKGRGRGRQCPLPPVLTSLGSVPIPSFPSTSPVRSHRLVSLPGAHAPEPLPLAVETCPVCVWVWARPLRLMGWKKHSVIGLLDGTPLPLSSP